MSRKYRAPQDTSPPAPIPEPEAEQVPAIEQLQQHMILLSRLLDQTTCPVCNGARHLHVSSMSCPMCPVRDDALRVYRELYDKEGNRR